MATGITMKLSFFSWKRETILVLCLLATSYLAAHPKPGNVFREYSWTTEKFHILSLDEKPFEIPGEIDLLNAISAEIVIELANQHLGFEGMAIRLNGSQWYPITFPERSPKEPSSSLWFHHWYPTISVALKNLKRGRGNTFEMKIPPECFDGKIHPNGDQPLVPWCPVYGVTVRVYYDPARKPHPNGRILSPRPVSVIGLSVQLKAEAKSKNEKIRQIDFIGRYEDINYEGDGIYNQWHGHLFQGRMTHHIGTIFHEDSTLIWNTEWVPDQPSPIDIAARITDSNGLIYMTETVSGLDLVRPGLSVELCKPFDVPRSFTGCQYGEWIIPGVRTQNFTVKGDLSRMIDARYVIASWGNLEECQGYKINDVLMEDKPEGDNWFYNLSMLSIRPLTVLKVGANTFSTVVGEGRMPDIYMPGVQILIKYKTDGDEASQPSHSFHKVSKNWQCFRGNTRQGISLDTNIPVRWSATQNVVWKTEIPGNGWSSPIIWEDKIFITYATNGDTSYHLMCINRISGAKIWDVEVLQQDITGEFNKMNSRATSTPCTDGKQVYTLAFDGSMAAVTMEGKVVWVNRNAAPCNFHHGLAVSPVLYNDLLIVPFDGNMPLSEGGAGARSPWTQAIILAVDTGTGKTRWIAERDSSYFAYVTPNILYDEKKGDQLISAAGGVVQGFDLTNGKRLWSVHYNGKGSTPAVVIGDGMVFTSAGFWGPESIIATVPGTKSNPEKAVNAWKQPISQPQTPSFIYYNHYLYICNDAGRIYCLKAKTGEIIWKHNPHIGNFLASPVLANGNLYFLSYRGTCLVLAVGPEYKEISRNRLNEKCQASPAISQGQLFIRTERNLYAIGKPLDISKLR